MRGWLLWWLLKILFQTPYVSRLKTSDEFLECVQKQPIVMLSQGSDRQASLRSLGSGQKGGRCSRLWDLFSILSGELHQQGSAFQLWPSKVTLEKVHIEKKLCKPKPQWSLGPVDRNDVRREQAEGGRASLQEALLADAALHVHVDVHPERRYTSCTSNNRRDLWQILTE